jgi:hypothetical protein
MRQSTMRTGLVVVLVGWALGLGLPHVDSSTHAQSIHVDGVRTGQLFTGRGPEDCLTTAYSNYDGSRAVRSSIKGSGSPGADLTLSAPATPGLDQFSYVALVAKQLAMPISTPTVGTATVTSTPSLTPTQTATPTVTSTPTLTPTSDVVIGEIVYDAPDEFVRIDNGGNIPQDMTDWRVESYANLEGICLPSDQVYTFTIGYVLDAGSSVRIHSGPEATDDPPDDPKWTGLHRWANPGDVAILYDSMGHVADTYCYGECCPLVVRSGRE